MTVIVLWVLALVGAATVGATNDSTTTTPQTYPLLPKGEYLLGLHPWILFYEPKKQPTPFAFDDFVQPCSPDAAKCRTFDVERAKKVCGPVFNETSEFGMFTFNYTSINENKTQCEGTSCNVELSTTDPKAHAAIICTPAVDESNSTECLCYNYYVQP